MKNESDPQMSVIQAQLSSSAVQDSLPKLEELPQAQRRELIQTLACLLLHEPLLQALLEMRHEPE